MNSEEKANVKNIELEGRILALAGIITELKNDRDQYLEWWHGVCKENKTLLGRIREMEASLTKDEMKGES